MLVEYRTVAWEAEITLIEKKSKFIARLNPFRPVKRLRGLLRKCARSIGAPPIMYLLIS